MADSKMVVGFGGSDDLNVFKFKATQALSADVRLEAWDNDLVFPLRDATGATTDHEIFDTPMIRGYMFTTGDTPAADWDETVTATTGAANPNLLKGEVNYCSKAAETDPDDGGDVDSVRFNLGVRVPSTAEPSDNFNFLIQIRYSFSGTTPTPTFWYNNETDGGTEAVPSWSAITPDTHGIKPMDTGSTTPFTLTIPYSGNQDAEVCVVVDDTLSAVA